MLGYIFLCMCERSNFDIQRNVHRDIFLYYKPTRCTISQIYFDKVLYMFRTDLLSIIRSLNTIYKQWVFVMLVLFTVC